MPLQDLLPLMTVEMREYQLKGGSLGRRRLTWRQKAGGLTQDMGCHTRHLLAPTAPYFLVHHNITLSQLSVYISLLNRVCIILAYLCSAHMTAL